MSNFHTSYSKYNNKYFYQYNLYGNIIRPLKPVNNKVIVPSEEEIRKNLRARSARLRIAEKIITG